MRFRWEFPVVRASVSHWVDLALVLPIENRGKSALVRKRTPELAATCYCDKEVGMCDFSPQRKGNEFPFLISVMNEREIDCCILGTDGKFPMIRQ